MNSTARIPNSAGFTLIEVVVALMILGGSLIVLLGLQTSIIDRTIRDEKMQMALLLSRRLFTDLETARTPPENMQADGPFFEVLERVSLLGADAPEIPAEINQEFKASINISNWGIPGIDEDVMRKVELTIYWGSSRLDSVTTTYFSPAKQL
jgi:prepilin-type N-terminal cleavage/methylation domain-containing protein